VERWGRVSEGSARFSLKLAILAGLPVVAVIGAQTWFQVQSGSSPGIDFDPDANTRLAQVRAFLAGQDWHDLKLYRFGFGAPIDMHWSRLSDLGPAFLLWIFSLFLTPEQAETTMMIVYPLALLFFLAAATTWTIGRLAPGATGFQRAIVTAVIMLQLQALAHFAPGNIDHHNLQIIALCVFLGACSGERTLRSGVIGAFGLVGGIIIGFDSVPAFAALIAAVGCLWLLNPKSEAPFLKGLGLTVLILSVLGAIIFVPRPFATGWCDSWTLPISTIMASFGAFAIFAAWISHRAQNRLLLVGMSGAVGILMLAVLSWQFPACRNPLPLSDPLIQRYWMTVISENSSLAILFRESPGSLAFFAPTFMALGAIGFALKRHWLTLSAMLPAIFAILASTSLAVFYSRGIPTMTAIIVPVIGSVLAIALYKNKTLQNHLLAWLCLSPLALMAISANLLVTFVPREPSPTATKELVPAFFCVARTDLPKLRALPKGTIVAPFSLSEYLFRYTDLQIAFAPYHRAYQQNLTMIKWLLSSPEEAHIGFSQNKVRYIVMCPESAQLARMAKDVPSGLMGLVYNNRAPKWLKPILELQNGGVVYEVDDTIKP
jgi:hypothetical protein